MSWLDLVGAGLYRESNSPCCFYTVSYSDAEVGDIEILSASASFVGAPDSLERRKGVTQIKTASPYNQRVT